MEIYNNVWWPACKTEMVHTSGGACWGHTPACCWETSLAEASGQSQQCCSSVTHGNMSQNGILAVRIVWVGWKYNNHVMVISKQILEKEFTYTSAGKRIANIEWPLCKIQNKWVQTMREFKRPLVVINTIEIKLLLTYMYITLYCSLNSIEKNI